MNRKNYIATSLLCLLATPALAAPTMTVVPGGLQNGNWVWRVDITPDFDILPDNSGTPVAVELGFRLTGAPLLSVANINPAEFFASNPGRVIFGWETLYSQANNHPVGIEANCTGCTVINGTTVGGPPVTIVPGTANEIFVALGSVNLTTPGPKPLLEIIAEGPATSGVPFTTLEWLGALHYNGNPIIAQIVATGGGGFTSASFEVPAGSATQIVPEPASIALLMLGVLIAIATCTARRR